MTTGLGRRAIGALGLAAAVTAGLRRAEAAWPERPLTIIVPFPAGGGADVVSRLVGRRLSQRLGQSVVIDNRLGAGGVLGFQAGARAAPDGYTLTTLTQNIAANPYLYPRMEFDGRAAFRLLSLMTEVFTVLLINPRRVPFRTLPELIDFARAKPDVLTAGNGGIAGNGHMAMELLNSTAKIEIRQIPYRGEAPMLNDLIGGQFDLGFLSAAGLQQYLENGSLQALAVSGAHRMPAFPGVPAVAEFLPGFQIGGWWGLGMPSATPEPLASRLESEIMATLAMPELRAEMAARGFDTVASGSAQFRTILDADLDRYRRLVADRRITVE
ncbi:MAG: hypothetical protein JWP20_2375 [Roseomonas sp.]|nr:hypothetical protein [Roseomonas sp.]